MGMDTDFKRRGEAAASRRKLPYQVKLSCAFMGLGQMFCRQYAKGALLMLAEAGFIAFFAVAGASALAGLVTLGTREAVPIMGIAGDNSVKLLAQGITTVLLTALFVLAYLANIRDARYSAERLERGMRVRSFRESLTTLLNGKFYFLTLTLPLLFVCVFNVMPIVFTALVAFTNYGGEVVPPKLVDWVGLLNFTRIFTVAEYATTILKILAWNFLWAAGSTFLNYFGGIALALLYNSKHLKGKKFWRFFPMLAYAVPSFITLIGFRFLFSDGGPVLELLRGAGIVSDNFSFLGFDAKWSVRLIGFFVCAWISIPSVMFLATGILSNASADVYEAARLDGAGPWKQFLYITLPFVLFATMPVLLNTFIANFNNFGIFYFLRGTVYMDGYFWANNTDLLINWMFNLSVDKNYYAIGAALSLILFVFMAFFSLLVYVSSPSYKKEDTYR